MRKHDDLVVATARGVLMPRAGASLYLPQGVNVEHLERVATAPPGGACVVGFFGLLAEWVDAGLVLSAAAANENVTFEFLGPVRSVDPRWGTASNIVLADPVPFDRLPEAIGHWHAGWIACEVSDLTKAVNPLKLREYLAAGLPTESTPMPEVVLAGSKARIIETGEDVTSWIRDEVLTDNAVMRRGRRASILDDSWAARAETLRDAVVRSGFRTLAA